MGKSEAKRALIKLLQQAYSGELAAALAYQGHHLSVRNNAEEKRAIFKIMGEELHHRDRLLLMICELGGSVDEKLEQRMNAIGMTIGFLCRVGRYIPLGWFISMYGAGRLESKNVEEYEHAARYAWTSGNVHFVEELLQFAEVEWEHEKYFREKAYSHPTSRLVPGWKVPPAKFFIRSSFDEFASHTPPA